MWMRLTRTSVTPLRKQPKRLPRGYRNNYIPCWDAECESLYKTFLQSPQGDDSSLAATALLAKLDRKRRDRWSEAVRSIDFSHSSQKAWSILNNLTGCSKYHYCENAFKLRGFVPETGARPVGMGLPRAAWVKLNRLRTGVGRFHSSMHKWGLAPSPNCECGASEQTADHVLTACPIHRAPHGARGLTVLDDETRCWLNDITASV